MKLCLISRFFDLRNAGIGRYSSILYKGLKNENINIKTITQDGGIPLGNGRAKYFFYTTAEMPFKIPKNYDIYHALSPMESLWLKKDKKSVVTFYDLIPMKYDYMIKTNAKNSIIAKINKYYFTKSCEKAIECDKITAISQQTANELHEHLGVELEKIEIIRPSIDGELAPITKATPDDTYRIGTISNLEPRKRVEILIKAFLKANLENSELIIGGKGPSVSKLKELSGNDKRIKFLGFVPDSELINFYNSLDVFVFPSLLEGYGIPIIEAMACGIPVVTLNDAIIPSDIKIKTFSVEISELKNTLINKSFKCDIKNNLNFSKEHSQEKMVEKILNCYKDI